MSRTRNLALRIILWSIFVSELATKCTCWNHQQQQQQPPAPKRLLPKAHDDDLQCLPRRRFLRSAAVCITVPNRPPPVASARNLPEPTGADESKTGTIETLTAVVSLRSSLARLEKKQYTRGGGGVAGYLEGAVGGSGVIPTDERSFKRVFDAYSDKVSYKQKFKDQNAFLVYYTKGYDGPNRPNMEAEDENQKQTLQFGARNEAWICWEEVLTELRFLEKGVDGSDDGGEEEVEDMRKYLAATVRAVDSYLSFAPKEDVDAVRKMLGVVW